MAQGFTLITPVYNEARVIEPVIRDYYAKVVLRIPGIAFIVAEDGSNDGTKEALQRLNQEFPFTLISSPERKGYAQALKDSLKAAKSEWVIFSDADGQHEPQDIFRLLEEADNFDLVSGYKSPRQDPWQRVFVSRAYNFLVYLLFGLKMRDIDSGFKLIRKRVIDDILPQVRQMRYCAMSELVLRAYLAGYRIKEIPVRHYPRQAGRSSIFTPLKLPLISLRLLRDLIAIKFGAPNTKTHV